MINSLSNVRVKQIVRWQTKAKQRKLDKVFVAEGVKMYLEAPADMVLEVYASESFLEKSGENPDATAKLAATGYETVSDEVFAKISDTHTPQGILTVLRQPEYTLTGILQRAEGRNRPALLLLLEGLQDPGNLGTILRTAEGAGITGVIMSEDTVDVFNPKVIRSTMGSVYRVPFCYEKDLVQTVKMLDGRGIRTYAAHLEGETYYDRFAFAEPTAFLIGNEGNGLSRELADAAASYLKIPMEGKLESLNASVAAALLMYEAHRQRNIK